MSTKVTTALGLVMGFIGGAMSHYFFAPTPVHAQSPVEIRAQKFILVDENGTPRGVFGFRSDGSPDLQVSFGKPKGVQKLLGGAEAGSVRWLGIGGKNEMPDLTGTHP